MADDQEAVELGIFARGLRLGRGLSLREAADELGISPATLLEWENGRSLTQVVRFHALLESYGRPVRITPVRKTERGI